jgi:hypothetical protein
MQKLMQLLPTFAIRWGSCLALVLLTALPAHADRDQRERWTLNMYVENDLFSETDQDYTSGIRFSWVSPDVSDYLEDESIEELPKWVRSINKRLTFLHDSHEGLQRNVIVSLGQQMFTPQDLDAVDLVEDDRPYAAWLFLGLGYQTRKDNQLDTLEVNLGWIGPAALGQEAQDAIHDLRGFEKFKGWDNQLRNEPGFTATWEHKRKIRGFHPNSRFGWDVIGHSGITIGNIRTHLNAGAEFRFGWALPDDFGTSAIRPGGENSTPDSAWDPRFYGDDKWGLHFFGAFDIRLVGQDIFLDGNSFKTSHSVAKESFVAEAAVGLAFVYGGGRISYQHIFRSREFSEQDHSHSYGSLAISYTF